MKTCKKLITTMIAASLLLSGSVFAKEALVHAKQDVDLLTQSDMKRVKAIISSDPVYIKLLLLRAVDRDSEAVLFQRLALRKLNLICAKTGVKNC